ncbi:E3 ubiquitin-protein ligase TRIM33-like [Mizuhopecten yessoensis]|uniref:E3 ubiquitin-protein ligase TRIM33 n=1 Tax=Mizuhopecten yessoensis TaxID=6573 RepID=A0A210QJ05_MIZYE|nr:E3 ubiquitin-protein ligase TRIM33-like [Mizuhopecten yessoensis]OWF48689.1 E3 ubiquitin-protein ligase TRIM33 [Mizuhopecten yessoensis]
MASNRSVRRAQEPVTYTCALCDSEDGVRWYCNDCQENLCDRCKGFHERGKKTKNDEVVLIGKANRQGDKPVPEVCKLHPGKLCDMFCSDCNELICSICLSKNHKQHNWKLFEDELSVKKEHFKEQMTMIADKIANFKNKTSVRHCVNKTFKDNIDTTRKEVNSQRTKLKAEIDSIANTVLAELSSLEKEESMLHKKDIQRLDKNVEELTRLHEKATVTDTSGVSIFETEMSLRKTLLLYEVRMKHVSPKQPSFVTGSIDRVLLTKMLGELHHENQYEKTDIDNKHVQRLSTFTVTQRNQILDICPVDDSHAWLSIDQYQGLILVNRDGVVTETVKLDFYPYRITMVGTTDILMTSNPRSTFVYKLSLHNKQVTTFADIRSHNLCDISINKREEVLLVQLHRT